MLGKWQYIHFYGNVPSWLKRLPTTDKIIVQRSTLFGGDSVGMIDHYSPEFNREWTANVSQWPIRMSSPERAILELIARLRRNSDFEYVSKYFESLIELHPKLLMMLLKACRSIKTKRLFFVYADLYQHDWLEELDTDEIDFGSGPYNLVPGGKFHPTWQISLPDFFSDFDYQNDCIF